MEPASEVLTSPALYLGRIEVTERVSRSRRRFRGTAVKRVAVRLGHGLLHRAPAAVLRGLLRYGAAWVNALAALPGNPLESACRDVTALAARRGVRHTPAGIARRFVDGARTVLELAVRLYGEGAGAVVGTVRVSPRGALERIHARHGAAILCVPHNTGAVFSAIGVDRLVPLLLVSRNSPSIERTRVAIELYERMGVRVLMVRDANPFEMSRGCLRALKTGHVLVATVDRIDRHESRVRPSFLGGLPGLGAWAAKIAVHARVPVVPTWASTVRGGVEVHVGEPLVADSVDVAMRHYLDFFEAHLARDPASWAFLGDRRWRWVLDDAVRGRDASDGGLVAPTGRA